MHALRAAGFLQDEVKRPGTPRHVRGTFEACLVTTTFPAISCDAGAGAGAR